MATEKQIQKLAGVMVEHMDFFNPLLGDNAQWVINHPKEAINLFVGVVENREREQVKQEKILELVEPKIVIPATEKFIAKDNFIVDTSKNVKIKIYALGRNFENWFLDKVEEPIQETSLSSHKFLKYLLDSEIIQEFGGEKKVETTLAQVYHLISQQPNGEAGVLLVNGWANIFYVRDKDGILRAVHARWHGGGWYLCAHPVENPHRWYDGNYVFSPQVL